MQTPSDIHNQNNYNRDMSVLKRILDATRPTKRPECSWDECRKPLVSEAGVEDSWGNRFCSAEHMSLEQELSMP